VDPLVTIVADNQPPLCACNSSRAVKLSIPTPSLPHLEAAGRNMRAYFSYQFHDDKEATTTNSYRNQGQVILQVSRYRAGKQDRGLSWLMHAVKYL